MRALLLLLILATAAPALAQAPPPSLLTSAAGKGLVERLRQGGLILYFRHADTSGMACDSSYRIGDRPGQRNLSAAGREQSRRIGRVVADLKIPVERPVLASPVFRARDTAELAFGAASVRVTDGLIADDYAGARLNRALAEHRRLMTQPPPQGLNRVLVGHRGPAVMVLGARVSGDGLPEGAAVILEPGGREPRVLGVLAFAPAPNPVESC